MKQLLTIAFLLLLASCGQSLDTETVERCLNGDCSDVTLAEEADTNDDQEQRLTRAEERLLCIEGELEHCGETNPFRVIKMRSIVRVDSTGFRVTEAIRDGATTTNIVSDFDRDRNGWGNNTYLWRYTFEVEVDGSVTMKEFQQGTELATNPGYIRLTNTLGTGELERLEDGTWIIETNNGDIHELEF